VPGFELPTSLACGSDLDPAWIARLPHIVAGLARRWSLEVGPPFQPGGCASWVAPARTGTGEHVVLKVGWRHDEALHEADGLRLWAGRGTVRLLDSLATSSTIALLLEACEPGTPLSQAVPEPEQDVVVAGLLQHMLNFPGRLAADPAGFARRMVGLLDLDADRVRLWLFARCVQESVCEPDLRTVAVQLAP